MNIGKLVFFLCVSSCVVLCAGTSYSQAKAQQIDALFTMVRPDTPGAAVLVVQDGHVAFERGYGVTDLRTKTKIDEQTNFRLASLSKQFTAMAIMLLVHDGKLRYDETLTEVFPEFPAYGKTITIRHLLNHTSGLVDYEDIMARQYGDTPDDKIPQITYSGVLALMEKATTTQFAAGSQWRYSNSGYCVLANVVEKVSRERFGDFLDKRIFRPLKMEHTLAYEKGVNEVRHRAYGHTPDRSTFRQTDQDSTSATLGDGGVYTSLTDLARWDQALAQNTLLSVAEMEPALTPVRPTAAPAQENGHPVSYGFGWFLEPYHGHERMWHYGETIGFRTSIQRFPKDRLTIIVLANRADLNATKYALEIADLYLGTGRR